MFQWRYGGWVIHLNRTAIDYRVRVEGSWIGKFLSQKERNDEMARGDPRAISFLAFLIQKFISVIKR